MALVLRGVFGITLVGPELVYDAHQFILLKIISENLNPLAFVQKRWTPRSLVGTGLSGLFSATRADRLLFTNSGGEDVQEFAIAVRVDPVQGIVLLN